MSAEIPKVSIGMPVYNGAATLAAALDALLAQTFTDFEVLISDNASTDATESICQAYSRRDARIRYERNPQNLGAAGNFNRVLARARGTYFKWFACDDSLAPTYLERCVAALDAGGREVVLAFPDRGILSASGHLLARDPYLITGAPRDEQTFDNIGFPRLMRVCGSRCPIFVFGLMRTDAARRTRGMGNYIAADLVFVAELRLLGRFRRVPETLFFQRLHPPTPEVLARTRPRGDAAWFDPRRRARFPEIKLLVEMVRAVRRADQPLLERWRCYLALAGHVATRTHRWSVLTGRKARSRLWRAWTRISIRTLAAARYSALPLRLWVLAAGLRHADRRAMRLAVSRPWWRSNSPLLGFGAERLGERDDARGISLLAGWVTADDAARAQAAAGALVGRAERFGPVVAEALAARRVSPERFTDRLQELVGAAEAEAWRGLLIRRAGAADSGADPAARLCQAAR